jgi:malto-oligosyltrehalose trehalohydrolase
LSVRTVRGIFEMDGAGDGWFEIEVGDLPAGGEYAFVMPEDRDLPDPAARAQVGDVHGPSRLIDPHAYAWRVEDWRGRPWHEAVVYELHVGTFTADGTFAAAAAKLEHVAALGVTAVELMPIAQFGGDRGWGYDGVLLYAPHRAYGTPEELKAFVDTAHALGLMVLLDVVYNHFGPAGNYLHAYAPDFFDARRSTPWGAAVAYERDAVRAFYVDNAVYWLDEYRLDGLRFDAIDQIADGSDPHILEEIAATVRGCVTGREIHLTTEDDRNVVGLHERDRDGRATKFTAEWNDDFHNAIHVIVTGETEGYYVDFAEDPAAKLARALAEGFAYQGETSAYLGHARGEPSKSLPPVAFIDFIQNHDQIGNRAFGERLTVLVSPTAVEALLVVTLLSPSIPLLFMGEEWGETNPFLFFTDFDGELAGAVREGRRREFSAWSAFRDPAAREAIPDPNAAATMSASRIDWAKAAGVEGRRRHAFVRHLLELRAREIVPRLSHASGGAARVRAAAADVVAVSWDLDGATLHLDANLGQETRPAPAPPGGALLMAYPPGADRAAAEGDVLSPYSVCVTLATARSAVTSGALR